MWARVFTLKEIFEKSWEYGKDLFACFVDLEKAYDRVPRDKLWKVLREYAVDGQLPYAPFSHYTANRRFVFRYMASNQSRSMSALDSVKGAFCYLSFLLFT